MTSDTEYLDKLRRAVLEKRLSVGSSGDAESPSRSPHTRSGPLPLSVSQNQLWYLSQLEPDSRAYNELVSIRKTGALDITAVRRALTEVVRRHESLRTTFAVLDGVPSQIVHEPTKIDVPLLDLSHCDPHEAQRRAIGVAAADTAAPYDLAHGPLLRARLIRITDEDHRLYLSMHHLLVDGVTLHSVLFPEFVTLYRDYTAGGTPSLPEPEAQYSDYTVWERDWVTGQDVADRIERWRGRLDGLVPTELPVDHPRSSRRRFAGGTIPFLIEHGTVERLRNAAQEVGATLFHALAAVNAWWLHSYTGSHDVAFGTPHDLRYRKDLSMVAGYCVTPLVVRCEVSGRETFTTLMERMREVVTDAVSDAVPFETLVGELDAPRDPRNDPLFQAALVLRPPLTAPTDEWSLHVMESEVSDAVAATKSDINIELTERPEGHITGRLFFSTELFERETAHEMTQHWRRLVEAAARQPGIAMTDHDLVTADDRARQLSWNPPAVEGISSETINDLLRSQVERTPEAVAVQVGDEALTYRQLDQRAAAIAAQLKAGGVGRDSVVATLLHRSTDLVAALLGILKAGAAFLPLDPRHPAARNDFRIDDAGAAVVLTEKDLPGRAATADDFEPVAVSPRDLACVMYTSGSTGRPKGVLLEHRNFTNVMRTHLQTFGVDASDTVLSVSSVIFDVCIGDILCALGCGARLVLATEDQVMDPVALARLISDSDATYMMATPTAWAALIASGWSGDRRLTAACAGETLTDALAEDLLQRCAAVWNAWGPTEVTVNAGAARVEPGQTVTVGTPFPGVRIHVVDQRGRVQPIGVPGEVAIGGVGVSRGYLNRPDEQKLRFVNEPCDRNELVYRTGDRGRFLPDGRLQHLGRFDEQVKIRGIRIEPAEIETTLSEHPDVKACAVVAREAPNGERQLVAYVIGEQPDDGVARDWLRRHLPEYMVPSAFVHLDAFPTTATGKLDKTALPAPSPQRRARRGDQGPRDDVERRVAELWMELLGVPVTDVNTDFFDMGGHSLLAVRLIYETQRTFGISLSLSIFVESGRTVANLAALVRDPSFDDHSETDTVPPVHFIFPDYPSAVSVRHFAAQWGSNQPVHPLMLPVPEEQFDRSRGIEWLAGELLPDIRERQPHGPYALVGYSAGAIVAYELAWQLIEAGEEVSWLGILDTPPPHTTRQFRTALGRLRRVYRLPVREQWAKYSEVMRRTLSRLDGPPLVRQFDPGLGRDITCRYDRRGHTVPLHLFVTEGTAAFVGEDVLGWDKFHDGSVTVHHLPGSHRSLLHQPVVDQLVPIMLESLSYG